MRIPMIPIFILIISLLSASVTGIDASVSMFVFLIITYKPLFFVFDFVVPRINKNFGTKEIIDSRRMITREFIREIDESGEYHE